MADRNSIITLPHESLRQRSQKVGIITDEIRALVQEMADATLDWEDHREHEFGVALAAVQIDRLYRIVVVRDDFEDKNNRNFTAFINPKIAKFEGELVEDFEGCLSVRDLYGKVPRYSRVRVSATGLDGGELRVTAEGFLARVFQHEIDHTNGILFIDHLKDAGTFYRLLEDGNLEKLDRDAVLADDSLWERDDG